MMHLEGYVRAALEAAVDTPHLPTCSHHPRSPKSEPCACHVGKVRFALSLYYGPFHHLHAPDSAELKAALGCKPDQNWVLCRRTARAVRQYGDDAMYLSEKQYAAGEAKALRDRMARMGVAEFAPCT